MPEDNNLHKDEPSRLDLIQTRLYKRGGESLPVKRSKFFQRNFDEKRVWDESSSEERKLPFAGILKILVVALLFFILSVLAAYFFFSKGNNSISNSHIDINVRGPVAVRAGDETGLQISITNTNSVPLETADLIVEYPTGTRSSKDIKQEELRVRQVLGRVASGETVNVAARAVLLGEEGTDKNIKIRLSYRIPGSVALFEKVKDYKVTISSSPINIVFDLPTETIPGEKFKVAFKVVSNSETVLRNVLLNVSYPSGFKYEDSSIKPSYGNNIWALGDLAPKAERIVEINGQMAVSSGDTKAFRAVTGTASDDNKEEISAVYSDLYRTIGVARPFVDLDIVYGEKPQNEYILPVGQQNQFQITWSNNLSDEINDATVELKLVGDAFDKLSVKASGGFYRSSDDTIIWDKEGNVQLAKLEPGGNSKINFEFAAKAPLPIEGYRASAPEITLVATMKGYRSADGVVRQPVEVTTEKKIKIQSNISLTAEAAYYVGPFTNIGPMPPKADQETTYTIKLAVANTANDLKGVLVTTYLPANIRWAGVYAPNEEDIRYNPNTRQISWRLGEMKAGVGVTSAAREVLFQIGATPSLGNLRRSVPLTQAIEVRGEDTFTGTTLIGTTNGLTSNLNGDPQFKAEEGNVVE
ncbi:MAG: hypothetical protein WCO03_00520 [bacterium]